MRHRTVESCVGLFMLLGIGALLMLALKVSGLTNDVNSNGYLVTANFANIGDLKVRAPVSIAGVRIGQVVNIHLNPNTYQAVVAMRINSSEKLLFFTNFIITFQI